MEQSPFSEAHSHSTSQEIPHLLHRTQRFITMFTRAHIQGDV
jgi:hypothetical protein